MGSPIANLRRKIALGQYELSAHAKEELEQDGFSIEDLKAGIYSGRITASQRHGRGPRKHAVQGKATDGRGIVTICRMTVVGTLRVVTVFADKP